MKLWKRSLLAQLVGCFSLLSVVTVCVVALAANNRAKQSLEQSVIDRLTVATALKEFQLNEWVNSQREDVLLISQLPEVQQYVATLLTHNRSDTTFQQAYNQLSQYVTNLTAVKPSIRSIVITTNGGFVIFSSLNPELEGRYKPLGEPTTYFTRDNANGVVPNFYTSSSTGKAAITFGTPLLDTNGVQMAAITVDLDLANIDQLIREDTGLGTTAETYLVGRAGAKTLLISGDAIGAANTSETEKDNKLSNGIHSPGIDTVIAKVSTQGRSQNYNDVPVIGVYRWLTHQNLALVAEISQAEAFMPAQQLAREILLIGLSSAGLLLVAVYLLSRRITQPILAIADTAIEVAEGNFNLMAPVLTQNEIGVLARAFNQMTGQLKHSNQQLAEYSHTLEQRVYEATHDLQDTLAYLASIIDNMADGLLVTDKAGRISRFNPTLLRMFQRSDTELVGQPCHAVLGEALAALVTKTMQASDQPLTIEIPLAQGRIGKASATAIVKQTEGNISTTEATSTYIGTVILVQDITTEKEVDRMKTDFISTVSHELRTPLTSVLGFAKIIKKKFQENLVVLIPLDDKKVKRTVQQISDNIDIIVMEGERLTTLINEVLDLAKMEAGRVEWNMQPIAISDIVERAITATTCLFEQKQLNLQREIASNSPMIFGDHDRLVQVVINLLSNAVKFTNEGSVICRIQQIDGMVVVSIVDQGIGIAEVDQPKVFEKFKQVGDTLTDKPKGTGLGLPICKEIVGHHNGQIWVDSELGQGSCFSFSLPVHTIAAHMTSQSLSNSSTDNITSIASSENAVNSTILETTLKLSKEPSNSSNGSQVEQQKSILVVDDDDNIRKLLRQELEAEGYQVQESRNGTEAVAQIRQHPPNLIILDVLMPDLNGFDVAAISKGNPQTRHIPIIILSSLEDRQRSTSLGIDCYLTKPVNMEALLRDVEKLVSQPAAQKVILILNDHATGGGLTSTLRDRGYEVIEASSSQDLIEKTIAVYPNLAPIHIDIDSDQQGA